MEEVLVSPGELLAADLALETRRVGSCLTGELVVPQPGGDEECPGAVLAPVRPVEGALLLVSVHRPLTHELLPTALALAPAPVLAVAVLVPGLDVGPQPLLAVHRQLADGAVEELDGEAVLSPPPHVGLGLLVQEVDRSTLHLSLTSVTGTDLAEVVLEV